MTDEFNDALQAAQQRAMTMTKDDLIRVLTQERDDAQILAEDLEEMLLKAGVLPSFIPTMPWKLTP